MDIDIEILQQQNKLTISNNKIYVRPVDKLNFTTYPLYDLTDTLALSLEEYLGLRAGYYIFKDDLSGLEVNLEN